MVLMNIIMFTVSREWFGCVECVKRDDAGEKKAGKRPPFYTLTSILIKAELEEHAQEDRRQHPISGLRPDPLGTYVVGVTEP